MATLNIRFVEYPDVIGDVRVHVFCLIAGKPTRDVVLNATLFMRLFPFSSSSLEY